MQDVADHRPRRRGDNADHAGQIGDRPLTLLVEQPLGREPALAFLEQRHKGAGASGLQVLDDDLVARAAGVGGELAGADHLQPVFGPKAEARRDAAPSNGVEDRGLVLHGEVDVARGGALVARHLAPDPNEAEGGLDRALEALRQFADREGFEVGRHRRASGPADQRKNSHVMRAKIGVKMPNDQIM